MSKQGNCRHQVQTVASILSTNPAGGGKYSVGLHHSRGLEIQAALARHISLHLPRLSGLQSQVWKGANTPPGIESLSVYLEV